MTANELEDFKSEVAEEDKSKQNITLFFRAAVQWNTTSGFSLDRIAMQTWHGLQGVV